MTAGGIIDRGDGTYACSIHGDAVSVNRGQWTGRTMAECTRCGAYMVVAERMPNDE